MIYPSSLKPGDTIAVIAPAGAFDHALLSPALAVLAEAGFSVKVMPHVLGRVGTFSGSPVERIVDFQEAWFDPSVRAVLCARGGYGVVHLLSRLEALDLTDDPKWLIGFSDISALHALLLSRGIVSVHASMLKGLCRGIDDDDNRRLIEILYGARPKYEVASHPLNRQGTARGVLTGGNLSVLAQLISTPYDDLTHSQILMIEDINEPLYKLERIMYQLELNGTFDRLSGLIVGQFAGCRGDVNYESVEQMIADATCGYAFPVAYGVPMGHVEHNLPMLHGGRVRLEVAASVTTLDFE